MGNTFSLASSPPPPRSTSAPPDPAARSRVTALRGHSQGTSAGFMSWLSRGQSFQAEATDASRAVDELTFLGLPRELALYIVDLAEYWPLQVSQTQAHVIVRASSARLASASVLISSPIPAVPSQHPVRRIRITTESRDQGFSSFPELHGTREGSSSWFELALIRPNSATPSSDAPERFTPPPITGPSSCPSQPYGIVTSHRIHYNIHASRTFESHMETLETGLDIVDQARAGDRLVLYACAQYPAWTNECRMARITVNYSAL
ncbi:BQ2448_4687 [Microbotryum intermedium]|uniref:BQ2448_4687 protein n=1 Tax=Microbotryum intermedium TaxID=269621 RepID=A0A238FJ15_9BASI|nr:BQ2448_4687 [Microbotryum intermedium]